MLNSGLVHAPKLSKICMCMVELSPAWMLGALTVDSHSCLSSCCQLSESCHLTGFPCSLHLVHTWVWTWISDDLKTSATSLWSSVKWASADTCWTRLLLLANGVAHAKHKIWQMTWVFFEIQTFFHLWKCFLFLNTTHSFPSSPSIWNSYVTLIYMIVYSYSVSSSSSSVILSFTPSLH
jgi:hypothetical protein